MGISTVMQPDSTIFKCLPSSACPQVMPALECLPSSTCPQVNACPQVPALEVGLHKKCRNPLVQGVVESFHNTQLSSADVYSPHCHAVYQSILAMLHDNPFWLMLCDDPFWPMAIHFG